jgi:outer membrane immunogenic protein
MSSIQIQTKSNGINFTSTQKLGIAALLVVASNVAIAEDKMNWAGPYAGINTGYTWVHDKDEGYAYGYCKAGKTCPASASNHVNGSLIGADIGYNFLFQNNLLLGIETEFKSYNANEEGNFVGEITSSPKIPKINSSFENKFSLLGKIGYLVNDKTLLYVKGGWANAEIKRDYTNYYSAVVDSHKSWQDGWTVGLGGEYNFYQNLTANLEYRYTDLGSKSIYASNMVFGLFNQTQNTRQNELNVGVAYHF